MVIQGCEMEQAKPGNEVPGSPVALLFTNDMAQVVFADHNFLEMTRHIEASSVLGEPLYVTLGINRKTAVRLVKDVSEGGHIYRRPLELRAVTGLAISVFSTGIATYDSRGHFIGADLGLHDIASPPIPEAQLRHHADMLGTHVRQVVADTARGLRAKTFIQAYFISKLDALQILLARVAGPQARATLEGTFNATAQQDNWPVVMKEGQIKFHSMRTLELKAYSVLMGAASAYVVDVVGRRLVAQEMQIIDNQMNAKTLNLANQLGMYRLWDDQV